MIQRLHGEAVRAFRCFVRNILRTGRPPRFGLLRVLYIGASTVLFDSPLGPRIRYAYIIAKHEVPSVW